MTKGKPEIPEEPTTSTTTKAPSSILSEEVIAQKIQEIRESQKELRQLKRIPIRSGSRAFPSPNSGSFSQNHLPDSVKPETPEEPTTSTTTKAPSSILSEEVIAQKIHEIRERQKELRQLKRIPIKSRAFPSPTSGSFSQNHLPDPRSNFESLRVMSPGSRKRLRERQRAKPEHAIELFNGVSVVQIKPLLRKKTVQTQVDLPKFQEILRTSSSREKQKPLKTATIKEISNQDLPAFEPTKKSPKPKVPSKIKTDLHGNEKVTPQMAKETIKSRDTSLNSIPDQNVEAVLVLKSTKGTDLEGSLAEVKPIPRKRPNKFRFRPLKRKRLRGKGGSKDLRRIVPRSVH